MCLIRCLCKKFSNEKNLTIIRIKSDHGEEFENFNSESFCLEEGIPHEFSSPVTLQQNRVVERKNCVLEEMARALLNSKGLAMHF